MASRTRKFIIEIECENAAFCDQESGKPDDWSAGQQIAECLKGVAESVAGGMIEGRIHDTNGNHVGFYKTINRKA